MKKIPVSVVVGSNMTFSSYLPFYDKHTTHACRSRFQVHCYIFDVKFSTFQTRGGKRDDLTVCCNLSKSFICMVVMAARICCHWGRYLTHKKLAQVFSSIPTSSRQSAEAMSQHIPCAACCGEIKCACQLHLACWLQWCLSMPAKWPERGCQVCSSNSYV